MRLTLAILAFIVSVPLSLLLGRWSDRHQRPLAPLVGCATIAAIPAAFASWITDLSLVPKMPLSPARSSNPNLPRSHRSRTPVSRFLRTAQFPDTGTSANGLQKMCKMLTRVQMAHKKWAKCSRQAWYWLALFLYSILYREIVWFTTTSSRQSSETCRP